MFDTEDAYYKRVIRSLTAVGRAIMALHGRDLYNMFGLYAQELKRDIFDLIDRRFMDAEFQPVSPPGAVVLPAMAHKNARRMRYMWDYFIYLYMSHKIQNIKRRQLASGPSATPNILYLRGSDYQLAFSREGAAVGHTTVEDAWFNFTFLTELKSRYSIVKALSPSDLEWAMRDVGLFLSRHGNTLDAMATFACHYDDGLFLNPANWKTRVVELFPSASLFLVYVSNQSNGLSYELECLLDRGLEANTILVLDKDRFGSRETFFRVQERLKEVGEELYLAVDRDACAVEDPEAFERLVARFPNVVELGDKDVVLREIETLIPAARRQDVAPPAEFPFEFQISLEAAEDTEVAHLRKRVGDFIEASLSGETVTNWPVLLLHIEMNIFLSLAFGDILNAAISTARYAAIAKVTRAMLKASVSEQAAEFDQALEQCGTMGMNAAHVAFGLGEWNDFSDRGALARARVEAAADAIVDLMLRSVTRADTVHMAEPRKPVPPPDSSTYSQLMKSLLQSARETGIKSSGSD